MKRLLIVLCFVLCIGVAFCYKKYEEQKACLAEGHDWYFSKITWRQSDEDPKIDLSVYVWECEECSAELSKIHVELTFEQQMAVMALNPSGKARIFRMRKLFN